MKLQFAASYLAAVLLLGDCNAYTSIISGSSKTSFVAQRQAVTSQNSFQFGLWKGTNNNNNKGMQMYLASSTTSRSTTSSSGNAKTKDVTKLGDLLVPSVGCGTISWSSNRLTELENWEIRSLISTACSENAAFFDTAERYGGNIKTAFGMGWGDTERMLQKHLSEAQAITSTNANKKLDPIVATKFTPSPWRSSAQSVVEACEQSRLRLGVDQIDLYQIHMPDIVQPLKFLGMGDNKDEMYWDGLAECYHRGLVKNVGVCNYGPTLVMKCQEALAKRGVPLASNQIAYSLIGRHNGAQETVDKCNELGVKVLAYYPFAMGLLTGKYSSSSSSMFADASASPSRKTKLEKSDLQKYKIDPLLTVLERIAEKRGKSVAQVALNYVICKGAIPIPGSRTEAQFVENIGAMGWRLTNTEIAMLELEADELGVGFDGAGFKRTSEKFVGYGVEKWRLD